jgi:D-apiose dehydrogenase
MDKLRGAVIGTGFWANYQIPAWNEVDGVEIVALYNRTRSKAEVLAEKYNIPNVYDDYDILLENEELDFIDIITDVDTHMHFTMKAAEKKINVICQKPMAANLRDANEMLEVCTRNGVQFYIHENFRWQAPIREVKKILDEGTLGKPFKGRVGFVSGFPVFDNQPFLAEIDKFIITDVGSHVFDIARFLFGEANSLYCVTQKVNPKIIGEDVANVLLQMKSGVHCYVEMSYASILEKEAFPQTLLLIECEKGSVYLSNDFSLKVVTREGVILEKVVQPKLYDWLDPEYAVVHSSIVDCNRNILEGLQGGTSETTGSDNIKTVELVWKSYESAEKNCVITL